MKTWYFRLKISNKFLLTIVGLWAALLVITVLPGSAFAQGPIEVLEELMISSVDNPGFQAVSGDVVVFDKNGDIYGYDLSTDTEFRITDQAASQQFPDISGDTAVWMDQRNSNWDIYGYDLGEDCEFPITTHTADQKWPIIDGNTVVWVDWRNGGDAYGGYDLYGYNLASGTEFPISGHSAPIVCPAISGNVVVWSDRRSGGWNIYSYDLNSGTETQITQWWASDPYCPAISNGIIVLGESNSIGGFDLFGNLLFETTTLSPLPHIIQGRPAIDGNFVIWQEQFNGYCPAVIGADCPLSNIVGYDIDSDHTFLIASHRVWFFGGDPAISGHVVVWREPPPMHPGRVYAARLLETAQLSVSSQFVDPGDVLTYTIALAEATPAGSHKNITNSLSSFTTLDIPSLSATSGNHGYDPETHVITWTGVVPSDNPITIIYNVTVNLDTSVGEHITNTAIISDQTSVFSRTVSSWVARRTYLPIIVKGYSP